MRHTDKFQIPKTVVNLKIANVVIQIQSRFPLDQCNPGLEEKDPYKRFKSFFYEGKQTPHIRIKVEIVNRLPEIPKAKPVFVAYHFQDRKENWRLLKRGNTYIYKSRLEEKEQFMVVNKTLDSITAYLLPKKHANALTRGKRGCIKKSNELVWDIADIIYDFLQVLLINYLAVIKKDGIFTHAIGIKEINKDGLLFAGKSKAGKSTLAKIYHKHSKAMVLNDDRIIVSKINNKFYIYGSPWYGAFGDYLELQIDRAKLKSILFLQKSKENSIEPVSRCEAFKLLYPAMFPTFWDRGGIKVISMFLVDLLSKVPCFRLKFKKNKSVIGFVRKTAEKLDRLYECK